MALVGEEEQGAGTGNYPHGGGRMMLDKKIYASV